METAEIENKETVNLLIKEVGDGLLKIGLAVTSIAYVFLNPFIIIGCAVLVCACRYPRQPAVKTGRVRRDHAGKF